jgi:glutamate synthase (NADPH/NADH) large chain
MPQKTSELSLYSEAQAKDNCGFGLIVNRHGTLNRDVVTRSIAGLTSMTHRGAIGSDGKTGDGCGLLFDLNQGFFQKRIKKELNIQLPELFGIAQIFSSGALKKDIAKIKTILESENLHFVCSREVPTDTSILGEIALESLPNINQVFIAPISKDFNKERFESCLLQARKKIEEIYSNDEKLYICSMSSQTIVYKGLMLPNSISSFYKDIKKKSFTAKICLFHQRFSTNTQPRWHLAQPFRLLAHNGEINAIRGNRNWVKARASKFSTPLIPGIGNFKSLVNETGSDSSALDNMIELLVKGGINFFRSIRMVLPPAWQNIHTMDPEVRAFHEYNSMHMEAWDGPAGIVMSDGEWAICVLDRNGLRPARYQVLANGMITVASETGIYPVSDDEVLQKGRLSPGGIFAVNTESGEILDQHIIDDQLKKNKPYREWLKKSAIYLESTLDAFEGPGIKKMPHAEFINSSKLFSLFNEERVSVIKPLALDGLEGTGSMGDDTALAMLSSMPRSIYDYFRQQFAQVTNPPIDSLRESSVMSLEACFGPELNIFEETKDHAKRIVSTSPVLSHKKLSSLLKNQYFSSKTFDLEYSPKTNLKDALHALTKKVISSVRKGEVIIHLNERLPVGSKLSINALLAVGCIHQELVRLGLRSDANLLVSSATARDTHQIACLLSFGATAVYPWLAFQAILDLTHRKELKGSPTANCAKYRKGINKGLLKIISKIGISTISSYRGSQLHEIVGLNSDIVNLSFTNTVSRVGGKTFDDLDAEMRSLNDYANSNVSEIGLGGLLKFVHGGEYHAYNPEVVKKLQEAVKTGSKDAYQEYADLVNLRPPAMLRDLMELKYPKKLKKIRSTPPSELLQKFDSAGMSLGALSPDAHETLAEAMNSMGARSNSGEGGEAKERYGTDRMSKIKQVASGRFGVTPEYLVNAEVLQIKIAQGAKPGEGGQLPGGKVNSLIAKLRYSTPGITLISPPPHHDIYSIEDLAQLIFDLKQVNSKALVSVKLVSEPGVGTIAAGVAKAYADLITISGHDGGTGASPLSSIRYAGSPWELGLSEAHQALRASNLRHKVRLQADGGLKTGLDVVKAAILGAESFGFGTGPMIAMGCKYLRICHLNNCATGVATQRRDIIDHHYIGEKERVVNYFTFIAQEVQEILAKLGVPNIESIIGQTHYLKDVTQLDPRTKNINLSPILYSDKKSSAPHFCTTKSNDPWDKAELNSKILKDLKPSILKQEESEFSYNISNRDRSVGAQASGLIASMYGEKGLKQKQTLNFTGSAGQSFGAWNASGLNLRLNGDANDYVGKGMNGGKIVISSSGEYASKDSPTVLAGNTALYGATGGDLYVGGTVGERFAVRNSGASAVIEGAGDHCCEYMTGGHVTVLGNVGSNFGAGMTGGFAYVLDTNRRFFDQCNRSLINLDRIVSEEMESHRKFLKQIIARHIKETKSERAKLILDEFDRYEPSFWLVSPAALNIQDLLKATTANAA